MAEQPLLRLCCRASRQNEGKGKCWTKHLSSSPNMSLWGHCPPNPWWLLCHKAPYRVPAVSLPVESSGVPQGPGGTTRSFTTSFPPPSRISFSLLKWTCHLGPQEDNLAHKSVHYRSRSCWGSKTTPWSHQEAAKIMAAPRCKRTCEQNHCTELTLNTVLLKSWDSNSISGAALLLREALRRPLNILPCQPLIWIQGPQSQNHFGRVQRSESSFSFYCNLPLSCPKISKGTI